MNIPPISLSSQSSPSGSPILEHFYSLWTNWYNSASKGSSDIKPLTNELINFLKDNKDLLENMTRNTKPPFGPSFHKTFSHLYSTTLKSIESWEKAGCDQATASEQSEWVGDVYYWCQAADPSHGY